MALNRAVAGMGGRESFSGPDIRWDANTGLTTPGQADPMAGATTREHGLERSGPPSDEGSGAATSPRRIVSWLLMHHLLSATAQAMVLVVVAESIFAATDSPAWVAAAGAARLLPYLCCSGFAGTIADRSDRRRLLQLSTWYRAAVIGALAAAMLLGADPIVLIAGLAITTTLGTVCYPAVTAAVPMVAGRRLHRASSVLNLIETSAWLIGPAIGGVLVVVTDAPVALAATAAVLVASAACLAPVPTLVSHDRSGRSTLARMTDGAQVLYRNPEVAGALLPVVFVNVLLGMSTVFLPVIARDHTGLGEGGFGVLTAALGAGGFVGALAAARLSPRRTARATPVTAGVAIAAFGGLALVRTPGAAIVVVAVSGAGAVACEVLAMTRLMTVVHHRLLARAVGVVDSLLVTALLTGTATAPVLMAALPASAALAVAAATLLAGCGIGCRTVRRGATARPATGPDTATSTAPRWAA